MALQPWNATRTSSKLVMSAGRKTNLSVFSGDDVDSDDDMVGLEGPQDDALANVAVASSHCNPHHAAGEKVERIAFSRAQAQISAVLRKQVIVTTHYIRKHEARPPHPCMVNVD